MAVFTAVVFLLLAFSDGARAQSPYPVRMRIEQMSIRARSASPVPVQIKLEYNRPQILTGTLELQLYDSLDVVTSTEMLASIRFEDISLSGTDYSFNAVLPAVQTSAHQNLAVQAWFETDDERMPLSSSLKEVNPPKPHDLLMISPYERGVLVCSCGPGGLTTTASANRHFLERALSLENYNRLATPDPANVTGEKTSGIPGRHIQYYAAPWAARDLPVDPLSYTCFDLVLLRDGALERLSTEQMDALTIWVRAGGSLCILPDGRLKSPHLNFIRTLFEKPAADSDAFTTDDEGRLQVIGSGPDEVLTNYVGLGRAALLPVSDQVEFLLEPQELGRLVAFLWKVRSSQGVWNGLPWQSQDLVDILQRRGIQVHQDENGLYLMGQGVNYRTSGIYQTQRYYQTEEALRQTYNVDNRLAPADEPVLTAANDSLMPEDVQMVPTWIIGLILVGYVATIGPIDYFVLGFFRLRKLTWVLFPIVTAFFTILTVSISHSYMSSKETGGSIRIVDVVDKGVPIRESRLEMMFYGSSTVHHSDHKNQFVVPANSRVFKQITMDDDEWGRSDVSESGKATLHYAGRFPNSYSVTQAVQQWSPRMIRTFAMSPDCPDLPSFDWSDTKLVTTESGRYRLAEILRAHGSAQPQDLRAVVLHLNEQLNVHEAVRFQGQRYDAESLRQMRYWSRTVAARPELTPLFADVTGVDYRSDFLGIVSQVSPEGSSQLEDLPFFDSSDEKQWALIIVYSAGNDYRVFRKLYIVEPRNESAEMPESDSGLPDVLSPDSDVLPPVSGGPGTDRK